MSAVRRAAGGLVGRDRELDLLRDRLAGAGGGRGEAVLVTGEAGVGKSRLVRHLAEEAHGQGKTVVQAHCVAIGGEPLRHAALVQLARSALPGGGRLPPLGEATTDVLLDRALTVVDAAAEQGTAMVVVEDVHWADRATCAVLMVLARHVLARPVLLVLTCRDDELPRGHHVWGFLTELQRAQLALPVGLGRLGPADVARLIGRLAGPIPPGEAARVFRRSGGNPLLVEELCAARVTPTGNGPIGEAVAGPAAELAPRARDLLLARADRLSSVALRLARAVAAAQGPVDEAVLGEVVGEDAARGLDEATDQHLLVREAGRVWFRHALVAEAVHGQTPVAERAAVHARWADALAARGQDAAVLAHHRYEAGDLDGALAASVAAADAAAADLSVHDAATHYRRALALWPKVPRPAAVAGRPRLDLCSQAAAAADGAGDATAAVAYAAEARAEAERRSDPLATSLLLEREAWYLTRLGDDAAARRRYRAAVDRLPADAPRSVRARVLAGSVRGWERAGDHDTAIDLGRRAVVAADEHGGDLERGQAHHMLARALLRAGREDAALAELGVAIPAAERARDVVVLIGALIDRLDVLAPRGRLDDVLAEAEAAAERLRATGGRELHTLMVSTVAAHARQRAGLPGRGDHARALLAEARTPATLAVAHLLVGRAATDAGSLGDAGEHLEMARFLAGSLLEGRLRGTIALGRAELALVQGRLADARTAVHEGLDLVERTGDHELRGLLCLLGLRVAAARTQTPSLDGRSTGRAKARDAAAIERYERGLAEVTAPPPAGERPAFAAIAAAGRAERTRLDGESAPEVWAEAVERWSAVGYPREAALATIRWAEALQRAPGGRDEACRVLHDALARARAVGSEPLAGYARRLARRAGIPLGAAGGTGPTGAAAVGGDEPADRGTGPAPLTRREVEVLELLADGASNRQIGALLYISTKTASVHVSRILTKLGVATRAEAADLAHRSGLTRRR